MSSIESLDQGQTGPLSGVGNAPDQTLVGRIIDAGVIGAPVILTLPIALDLYKNESTLAMAIALAVAFGGSLYMAVKIHYYDYD